MRHLIHLKGGAIHPSYRRRLQSLLHTISRIRAAAPHLLTATDIQHINNAIQFERSQSNTTHYAPHNTTLTHIRNMDRIVNSIPTGHEESKYI